MATDSPEVPPLEATSPSVTIATGYAARRRRRKFAFLALLLAVLALLAYAIVYFQQNRRLPLPRITAEATFDAPQYLYSISGEGATAMSSPVGIAVSGNRLYEVDVGTRSVRVYRTTSGAYLFSFNTIDDGANKALKTPVGIAVGPNGDLYVTDRLLHGIYVFDPDGRYKGKIVPNGDDAFPWLPLAIGVDQKGNVFVSDIPSVSLHRIIILDKNQKVSTVFGQAGLVGDSGLDPGVFSYPNGLVASSGANSQLFIADSNNRRIQVFSLTGSFLRVIRTQGNPRGIAVDPQGRIYCANSLSHLVDVYSRDGEQLGTFGEMGVGPGQFRYPEDLDIGPDGRIYVSDRENDQVQVWGYPRFEIPGITKIAPNRWWICLLPLPLFLLPLLFRRRRFFVTQDFVDGMAGAGLVHEMVKPRWRWIVPESEHANYVGRVVDGVDLGQLMEPEPYSESDARALAERLRVSHDQAKLLTMAKRCRIICTEDPELARLATLLGVDPYDQGSFLAKFGGRKQG